MDHVKFRAVDAKKDPKIPRLSNLQEIQFCIHVQPHLLQTHDKDENPRILAEKVKMQLRKIGISFRLVIIPPDQHFSHNMVDRL